MSEKPKCALCGEPMPDGEEMFHFHGHSSACPIPRDKTLQDHIEELGKRWQTPEYNQLNEKYEALQKECEKLRTIVDFYNADPQTQWIVHQYSELNMDDRKKIDNLMKALLDIKRDSKP